MAPCKTFSSVQSKTDTGGEINCIDSGGFGAITITKSLTIDGAGAHASILASGTTGIIINAPATHVVTLRNLSINGAGNGQNGIRYLSAAAVHIENCVIFGFSLKGIDANLTANGALFIANSVIHNCASDGIHVRTSSCTITLSMENVRVEQCLTGSRVHSGARANMRGCAFVLNETGLLVEQSVSDNPQATCERCKFAENKSLGIRSGPGTPSVRLSQCVIANNATGLSTAGGGQIVSFKNNLLVGNVTQGAPTTSTDPI